MLSGFLLDPVDVYYDGINDCTTPNASFDVFGSLNGRHVLTRAPIFVGGYCSWIKYVGRVYRSPSTEFNNPEYLYVAIVFTFMPLYREAAPGSA